MPQTIGSLVAGNLLIADFNNAGGTSGAGTWLAMGQGARRLREQWNVNRDLE